MDQPKRPCYACTVMRYGAVLLLGVLIGLAYARL
jgi:hypothetical protein